MEAREVELTSPALMALSDLKDGLQPADHYRPAVLEELQKAGFVRDFPNDRVGITASGLDHLMPSGKPRPYVKPVLGSNGHAAHTPPVSEPPSPPPVTPPASQSPKLVGSTFVLAALKKAGGSMTREALNADGRTLRKMASDGAITLDGELVNLTNGKKSLAPTAAPPPVTKPAPILKSVYPATSAETNLTPPIEPHTCEGDCSTCATGRALAFLTSSSPALAAMVERFQAHEADQQRLKSFDS